MTALILMLLSLTGLTVTQKPTTKTKGETQTRHAADCCAQLAYQRKNCRTKRHFKPI